MRTKYNPRDRYDFLARYIIDHAFGCGFVVGVCKNPVQRIFFLPKDSLFNSCRFARFWLTKYGLAGAGSKCTGTHCISWARSHFYRNWFAKTASRSTKSRCYIMGLGISIMAVLQGLVAILCIAILSLFGSIIHPGLGLLLPLGLNQGPGQALSMGSAWETTGLENGGQIGLILAASGFCGRLSVEFLWHDMEKKKVGSNRTKMFV